MHYSCAVRQLNSRAGGKTRNSPGVHPQHQARLHRGRAPAYITGGGESTCTAPAGNASESRAAGTTCEEADDLGLVSGACHRPVRHCGRCHTRKAVVSANSQQNEQARPRSFVRVAATAVQQAVKGADDCRTGSASDISDGSEGAGDAGCQVRTQSSRELPRSTAQGTCAATGGCAAQDSPPDSRRNIVGNGCAGVGHRRTAQRGPRGGPKPLAGSPETVAVVAASAGQRQRVATRAGRALHARAPKYPVRIHGPATAAHASESPTSASTFTRVRFCGASYPGDAVRNASHASLRVRCWCIRGSAPEFQRS